MRAHWVMRALLIVLRGIDPRGSARRVPRFPAGMVPLVVPVVTPRPRGVHNGVGSARPPCRG